MYKISMVLIFFIIVLVSCGDSSDSKTKSESEKAVEAAFMLCSAMKNTGLTTECEVKGWGSSVDVRMDTNGEEARKICVGVVKMMAAKTNAFNGKWELRIFSPFSGEHPIASCTLR